MGDYRHVEALLQSFVDKGLTNCSCSVIHRGETVYEGYFGYANPTENRPVGPETIFRIYSMTKVITCTVALMLYERGLFC